MALARCPGPPAKRRLNASLPSPVVNCQNRGAHQRLTALAAYRFLQPKQLLRLGVSSSKSHLHHTLRVLSRRRPALIHELPFGPPPRAGSAPPPFGRRPNLYFLTRHGVDVLAEHDEGWQGIKTHRHVRLFPNDYAHRVGCVDFHLSLRAWAERTGTSVDFFDAYYDPVSGGGPGRKAPQKTYVGYPGGGITPDAIFSLTDAKGVTRLYAFELYRSVRTALFVEKLSRYLPAINTGAIEDRYKYPHSARILCLFDNAKALGLVARRMKEQPALLLESPRFLLSVSESLDRTLPQQWWRFDGNEAASPFS